jgi:DNA replication protein DnaD
LKEFKKKGFKTLAEVEEELENKRKKDEKIRRKG